jgi:hypothetical protein
MHFDDDETWQVGAQVDLFSVALHEAGHALGLGHSDRPGAVMYPYYRTVSGLTDDDIRGIRSLYGDRDAPAPQPPPVAPPESPSPDPSPALELTVTQPVGGTATTSGASIGLAGATSGGTGTVRVTWMNNRGGSGTAMGSSTWSIAAIPLATGENVITVRAGDGSGRTASVPVTVTRQQAPAGPDTTPPSLRITSPGFTIASTSAASITLRGTAADNTAVAGVRWTNSTGFAGDATGTTAWSASVPLRVGTNVITVQAADAAGNTGWRTLTVVKR